MVRSIRPVVVAIFAGLFGFSIPPPVGADPVVTIHRVSDQSPFEPGACASDIQEASGSGELHGYEQEPAFVASPDGLISAWIQDGALGIVAAHSTDGGESWSQSVPPGLSICQGVTPTLRVLDPKLVVSGSGTIFLSAVGGMPSVYAPVTVSTSRDGGETWSQPTMLSVPWINDYPTISADPLDPDAVAAVWHGPLPNVTWFARTADDGATWSPALPIRVGPADTVVRNGLLTLPDGTLIDVIVDSSLDPFDLTGNGVVFGALRSADHGATWTETTFASLSRQALAARDPTLGPDGAVYVLFSDVTGSVRTWKLMRSFDGVAWSQVTTVPVPDDAFPSPSVALAADGTIGVLYDDHRNDQPGGDQTTDVWLTFSRDGGANWSDLHLGGPFDLNAVSTWGTKVGDYQELHAVGDDFGAVFALGAPHALEGTTDIYFARIAF